jgi:CheY-like chemotaxis protein
MEKLEDMKAAILCVDDEPVILESLEMQLEGYFDSRYVMEFAESAEEALDILNELEGEGISVLVIVTDWLMPGMKGDEFLIKAHQTFPHIVKIMLTGQADEEAIERARRDADLFECIHKPWEADVLTGTIERALQKFGD